MSVVEVNMEDVEPLEMMERGSSSSHAIQLSDSESDASNGECNLYIFARNYNH